MGEGWVPREVWLVVSDCTVAGTFTTESAAVAAVMLRLFHLEEKNHDFRVLGPYRIAHSKCVKGGR